MKQKQVRIIYNNGRSDSIFGPYATQEQAEDIAAKARIYAGVEDVIIEAYRSPTGE